MVNFLKDIQNLLKSADDLIRTGNEFDVVIENVNDLVIGTYYSNLLKNFFDNLNEENIKEYSLDKSEIKEVQREFNALAKRANRNFTTATNKCKIYKKDYDEFKKELKRYKSLFKLLLEIEKIMNKEKCDQEILHFLEKVKNKNREEINKKWADKKVKGILSNTNRNIEQVVIEKKYN